ncbi:MAG: hypothetical protein HUJ75_05125, partial [Parasporobacterium sp.]|nr:hypothetical protein [Parasporobacterium sp.]
LRTISREEWAERTEKLLADINGSDSDELFLTLYKAQYLIGSERFEEAKALIEFISTQLNKLSGDYIPLRAYYLYVKSLYELDDEVRADSLERIRQVYRNSPSWPLLWMLIYMDPDFAREEVYLFRAIEELYNRCHQASPFLYAEALEVMSFHRELNDTPSDFALQVLIFAARRGYKANLCYERMAIAIEELSDLELNELNTSLAVILLKEASKVSDSRHILGALCRLLMFIDDRDSENHRYFARAINELITSEGIYHYFVFTMDNPRMDVIPDRVLGCFMENQDSLENKKALLLANVVLNKDRYPDYYDQYKDAIVSFVEGCMIRGYMDSDVAILCRDILETKSITPAIRSRLYALLCTREITVNSKAIRSVAVFHKELPDYKEYNLKDGRAYIKILSNEYLILFKAAGGGFYADIDYELNQIVNANQYIDLCIREASINKYMLIGDCLPITRAYKDPGEVLRYLYDHMGNGDLRNEYEQKLLRDLVIYFGRNTHDQGVNEGILRFLEFDLDEDTRGRLIEILIDQNLYREAYEQIEKYGYSNVDTGSLSKLTRVLAPLSEYEEDELLTDMASLCFAKEGYDPEVFAYLCRYYDKDLNVLLRMYTAANAYGAETTDISERIVRHAYKSGVHPDNLDKIFAEYFEAGTDDKLKQDYISMMARNYLYRGMRNDTSFFGPMEKMLLDRTEFDDAVLTAYLLYTKDQSYLSDAAIKVCEKVLRYLTGRGVMLEEFKAFSRFFELPAVLANSYVASTLDWDVFKNENAPITQSSLFSGKPSVAYIIHSEEGVTEAEDVMNEIFPGCFAKYFTLFYGETLTYSIAGGSDKTVSYSQLNTVPDFSRYSDINNLLRLRAEGGQEELVRTARDYFVKSRLIDRLF